MHPLCEAVAEPRRRFPLHAAGESRPASFRARPRAWWRCSRRANTIPRRCAKGSPICGSSARGCGPGGGNHHYFYGQYYAAQAMWLQGGDAWAEWYPAVRDELLSRQSAAGYWTDTGVCSEYGTAMALIILQIPNDYLPIFQR